MRGEFLRAGLNSHGFLFLLFNQIRRNRSGLSVGVFFDGDWILQPLWSFLQGSIDRDVSTRAYAYRALPWLEP